MTSCSRLGEALRCSTAMPSRTRSVQARTPGAPSTATRQFGHCPAQHSRPRRRWYLKLRENVRRPPANRAEAIVSPASASTSLPSKVKLMDLERSRRSPGCTGRRVTVSGSPPRGIRPRAVRRTTGLRPIEVVGEGRPVHVVGSGVALADEPGAAAGAVVPPLPLNARRVAAEAVVGAELAQGGALARPAVELAAEGEVRDFADTTVRAGQEIGHGGVVCCPTGKSVAGRDEPFTNRWWLQRASCDERGGPHARV